jgi:hypothetical protein
VDDGAGDAAGAVRGEEDVTARVVLAAERDLQRGAAAQVLLAAGRRTQVLVGQPQAARPGELGAQRAARRDAVDPHVGGQFVGQRDHAAADGELGRHVEDATAAGIEAGRGYREHYRAARPAQLGQRRPHRDQLAFHVDREHLVEGRVDLVLGNVGQAAVEVEDAHAVDQDVQAAEGLGGRVHGRVGVGQLGRITGADDAAGELDGQTFILMVVAFHRRYPGTFLLEGGEDGAADAGARADDEGALAGEPAHQGSSGPCGVARSRVKNSWSCQVRASSSSGQSRI